MRRLLLLLLLLPLAACSAPDGDGVASAGGATPGASATAGSAEGDPLAYARCMRENGLTFFQDPAPDEQGIRLDVPRGFDQAIVDKALAACKHLLPDGGRAPELNPEDLERMRQMSKCMRENGIPDFPDPSADGSLRIDGTKLGVGPGDPVFEKAQEACAKFRPPMPREGA